jgi:ABC-2 type transport system permease protein
MWINRGVTIMKMRGLLFFELKKILKSPLTFLFIIVAPTLLIAMISYGIHPLLSSNSVIEKFDVAIVNQDNSSTSRSIIEQFQSSEEFADVVSFVHVQFPEGKRLIQANKVASIVIIPEGFSSSLKKGENKPLEVIGNYKRPLQSTLFKEMMTSALNLITAAQSGVNTAYHYLHNEVSKKESKAIVKDAIVHFTFHSLSRHDVFELKTFEKINFFTPIEYYSSAGIIVILYIVSLFSIIVISTKESEAINNRLITFGVGFVPLVIAKFFTILTVLAFQLGMVTLSLLIFVEQFMVEDILLTSIVLILILVAVSAINTFFISLRLNALATSIVAFITFAFMSYAGGSIIPLTILPENIRIYSVITINHWGHHGLLHSLFISDFTEMKKSILPLITFTCISLALSLVMTKIRMRQL